MKRKQSQGNGSPSQILATKQGTPPPSQPETETVMDLIHVGEDNENNRAISSDLEKNEVAPFSKKKKKSKVWDDFQLIEAHLNDDGLERDMATSMKAKFEKYWDSYSLILTFAIILDPRYKLSFVTYCYKILNKETYTAKVSHVTDRLYQLYNEYAMEGSKLESANNATMPTTTVTEVVGNKDRLMEGFENFDMKKVHTSQLRQYLEEGRQSHRQPLDILEFWKKNEKRLPNLARMARDILSIPITTIASESAFSMGGHVLTKLRGSLLLENAEALITSRTWLNGFQKEGDNTATGHAEDEVLGYEYQFSGSSAVANN
ncbi:hypothetical protein SLEP1_g48569 [Rubroshorea leprosula]|uniref:Transposase n=1 Tax=Rubroshorea leprosula TaxID=152421 RepID=A0AAV5LU07_9ROSI|nr:hypothetical protein SLEP1_g48569 [Rubroshorea leprosula]